MSIYQNRRQQLAKGLKEGENIFIFSGKAIMCSEDEAYPFHIDRNFYYLTGLDRSDMVLNIRRVNDKIVSTIFIEPYDELMAKWVGPKLKADEVKAISGINNVHYIDEVKSFTNSLVTYARSIGNTTVYLDLWRHEHDQNKSEAEKFAAYLKETYPDITIEDIRPNIACMRMIKDEVEIEHMRKAIATTKYGIEVMMRAMRPGISEMVIDKAFDFALASRDCDLVAFKTIAAGGKRATTLHYSDNDQILEDDTLFLCDLGATDAYYCADISRTFPVNGHFTERQKEIYDIVLSVQRLVEENARPGITLRDLQNMVIDYYKEELPKHGLDKDVSEYYFHGIGHHLGLDTHDISDPSKKVLEPGMVITNEPGLYIADEGIGIRIEDDLLITEEGCENLAKDILHTTDEIEAFMKR